MSQLRLDLPDNVHKALQNKVGYGNVSGLIRNYINHIISSPEDEDLFLLQKRLDLIKEQKEKIDREFFDLQNKIDGIQDRERIAEINKIKAQEKERQEKLKQAELMDDAIGASGILEEFAERLG